MKWGARKLATAEAGMSFGIQTETLDPKTLNDHKAHFITGHGGYPLVGTAERETSPPSGSRRPTAPPTGRSSG
jgi:hypothetical protein